MAENKNSIVKKLEVESHKRITRSFLGNFLLVLLIGFVLSRIELVFERIILNPKRSDKDYTITVDPSALASRIKPNQPSKPAKQQNNPKRNSGRGNPHVRTGIGGLLEISSVDNFSSHKLYQDMSNHIDKLERVIDKIGMLKDSKKSEFTGRRGKKNARWNEEYSDGDPFGEVDITIPTTNVSKTRIRTQIKGEVKPVSGSELTMEPGNSRRSAASILRVVRSHMSGLRHAYNKHLKKNPGFSGKIHIRFEIAPSGKTIKVSIAGSSTGVPAFDAEVKNKVRRWRFEPINAKGNDIVTIPFTFSE